MASYAIKTDLKNAIGINTSSFAKEIDLNSLKSSVDELNIDKLKNVPTDLSNLKGRLDKLDVGKLFPVPVDFSKLSDILKNFVF